MGLLSKLFRKKKAKINEEPTGELTEKELDKVCGHTPNNNWCPKVDVPEIKINSHRTTEIGKKRSDLER